VEQVEAVRQQLDAQRGSFQAMVRWRPARDAPGCGTVGFVVPAPVEVEVSVSGCEGGQMFGEAARIAGNTATRVIRQSQVKSIAHRWHSTIDFTPKCG
jgi:hypothetical protein